MSDSVQLKYCVIPGYSYFQVNRPRGRGTAMVRPYGFEMHSAIALGVS
ncbi:hypothetical protein [Nostoc sp. NMS8]|nr:hypothetical protein [Nostoc sp. NMS8]MBN3962601.1 hypothetical protein [Nostoc sp. NMS8]